MAVLMRKWKIPFALITMSLVLLAAYVFTAWKTFHVDKSDYVARSQSARLAVVKRDVDLRLRRALTDIRGVVATFQPEQGRLSRAGQLIFHDENWLLGLEIFDESQNQIRLHLEKNASLLPPGDQGYFPPRLNEVYFYPLSKGVLLARVRYAQSGGGILRLQAALTMSDLLPHATPFQSLALAEGDRILTVSDVTGIDRADFHQIARGQTPTHLLANKISLGLGQLDLYAATPKAQTVGTLGVFFHRSVVYILFCFFALFALAAPLTRTAEPTVVVAADAAKPAEPPAPLILLPGRIQSEIENTTFWQSVLAWSEDDPPPAPRAEFIKSARDHAADV